MADHTTIRPQLNVLSDNQIAAIHEAALRVLSTVGVRMDEDRARRLLVQSGARPGNDELVYLPADLVEWALRASPSFVDVYARTGELAFRLGIESSQAPFRQTPERRTAQNAPQPLSTTERRSAHNAPQPLSSTERRSAHNAPQPRFGIGVSCLYYQEPETDRLTPFTRQHMRTMVRLGDALPEFDVVSTVGVVRDVAPELSDLYAALEMAANTTKPLVMLVADEGALPHVLDLLEELRGDLAQRPFLIPYVNPVTPLVINASTSTRMFRTIERGLPLIYSSYGMAGATTPITPFGTLVLLHAELLAGLTLSQLIQEGTSVILGSLPAYFHMRSLAPFYDARSYVINSACAEMMVHYGLPHAGTSGSGIGWGPDPISFGHQWMNHLTSCMGNAGLVPFVGDNLGSKAFSPVLAVYANEVIGQARRLAQGFAQDEMGAVLEEIAHVAPGGDYLSSNLTRQLFRDAFWQSAVFPNMTLETWQEQGSPKAIGMLRRHTLQLLKQLDAPPGHDEWIRMGEARIERLRRGA